MTVGMGLAVRTGVAWALLLLGMAGAWASGPGARGTLKCPAEDRRPAASRESAAYRAAEHEAILRHRAGRTSEAVAMLEAVTTAGSPSADRAAASLRLGYLKRKAGDRKGALRSYREAARIPEGIHDGARTEAALRLGYMDPKGEGRPYLERIVSGELGAGRSEWLMACKLLGASAHAAGELGRAIECFGAVADNTTDTALWALATCELAGLHFEQSKGEGGAPVPPERRSECRARTRELCQSVIASTQTVTREKKMLAELMFFETFYFDGDHDRSYRLGRDFLRAYDRPTAALKGEEPRYLNAARMFHMQNCWITGKFAEAAKLAREIVASPPARGEEFPTADSFLYATVVGSLAARQMKDNERAMQFERQGRRHNRQYFKTLAESLAAKRMAFQGAAR